MLIILVVYLFIGISLVAFGPAKNSILRAVKEVRGSPLANALQGRNNIPESKVLAFRVMLSIGTTLLWPAFIFSILKENTAQKNEMQGQKPQVVEGMKFSRMGGFGKVSCCECHFSEAITSFLHGVNGSSTGYQCQACGKFAARHYENPFPEYDDYDPSQPLTDVPPEYRPDAISHILSMVSMIEGQMQKTPKDKWMSSWKPCLTAYRAELNRVPPEEIEHINKTRDEVSAAFKASLFCECGGTLDREKVLFCPGCRSTNLSYGMKYIT